MRRITLAGVGALALATVLVSSPATATGPTFTVVDSTVNGSELNVGVAPNGNIYVGGWDAVGRSTDGGTTWTRHATMPAVSFAADRVLIVDHDTGRVLVNDTTLGCTILSWSDDNAATWRTNPAACGGGVTDHQKIAVGKRVTFPDPTGALYRNLIYVCANGLSHTNCGVSDTEANGTACSVQVRPLSALLRTCRPHWLVGS